MYYSICIKAEGIGLSSGPGIPNRKEVNVDEEASGVMYSHFVSREFFSGCLWSFTADTTAGEGGGQARSCTCYGYGSTRTRTRYGYSGACACEVSLG
jgi:hypothetical protein